MTDKLDEKTLTPAEMRKKEEIVKKLKGKTGIAEPHAVATAIAKRVAEEVDEEDLQEVSSAQKIKTSLKRGRALRKGTSQQRKLARGKKLISKKKGKQLSNAARNARRTEIKAQRKRLTGGKSLSSGAGGVAKRVRSSTLFAKSSGAQSIAKRKQRVTTRLIKKRIIKSSFDALINKSNDSNIPLHVIVEVYDRGILDYDKDASRLSEEQSAFARVNSFISGGAAATMDADLYEDGGAGEWGTDALRKKYCEDTPGQTPEINYVGSQKPEVADTFVAMSRDMDEEFERMNEDVFGKKLMNVRAALKGTVFKKHFTKAMKTLVTVKAKSSGRRTSADLLDSVARSHDINTRDLMSFIKGQIKLGNAPKEILEDKKYDK